MDESAYSRRTALKAIGTAGVVGFAGCASSDGGESDGGGNGGSGGTTGGGRTTEGESVRAAFVFNTPADDNGWIKAHNDARMSVDDKYDWLETAYSESVDPPNSEPVFRDYANQGYDVVFASAFGFGDQELKVSKEYPDTHFEQCAGFQTGDNLGLYFLHADQAWYLAGAAAAMVTETKHIGFVTSFPIAQTIRDVNAFAWGARSVDDTVTTKVRWISTWFDPPKERDAAQSLIDDGADVLTFITNTPTTLQTAVDNDAWGIGQWVPMGDIGDNNYLTGVLANWAPYYEQQIKKVREGSWKAEFFWGGFESGMVDIDDWGPQVPDDVNSKVGDVRGKLESGDLNIWAGTKYEDWNEMDLYTKVDAYVPGVEGELPKSN